MPLDIDDIRKGRRRDWDKLLSPEEQKQRREEEKEAKESELAKKGLLGVFKRKRRRMRTQEEMNQAEWRKAKRDTFLILGGFFLAFAIVSAIQIAAKLAHSKTERQRIAGIESQLATGVWQHSLDTPIEAWASWRMGWLQRDGRKIFATNSRSIISERTSVTLSDQGYIRKLQQRIDGGLMNDRYEIARQFEDPVWVHRPKKKPKDGDLAVLKTQPITLHEGSHLEGEWAFALVYETVYEEWRFEMVKPIEAWSKDWTHRNMIQLGADPVN